MAAQADPMATAPQAGSQPLTICACHYACSAAGSSAGPGDCWGGSACSAGASPAFEEPTHSACPDKRCQAPAAGVGSLSAGRLAAAAVGAVLRAQCAPGESGTPRAGAVTTTNLLPCCWVRGGGGGRARGCVVCARQVAREGGRSWRQGSGRVLLLVSSTSLRKTEGAPREREQSLSSARPPPAASAGPGWAPTGSAPLFFVTHRCNRQYKWHAPTQAVLPAPRPAVVGAHSSCLASTPSYWLTCSPAWSLGRGLRAAHQRTYLRTYPVQARAHVSARAGGLASLTQELRTCLCVRTLVITRLQERGPGLDGRQRVLCTDAPAGPAFCCGAPTLRGTGGAVRAVAQAQLPVVRTSGMGCLHPCASPDHSHRDPWGSSCVV